MDDSFLSARDFPSHPPYVYPGYNSSVKRGPTRPLIPLKERLRDQRVPVYGTEDLGALDHDLTRNAVRNGEPLGERIIVTGRVLDEGGRPVRNTLVEIWQANAAGRYVHKNDQHDAPILRAAFMLSIYLVARLIYRGRSPLNALGVAAAGVLLLDPAGLLDASFVMTFVCVLIIAGIGVPLLERTSDPWRRGRWWRGVGLRSLCWLSPAMSRGALYCPRAIFRRRSIANCSC